VTRPMLQPFVQGRLDLRSRVVMPPILDRLGSQDGYVTEQLIRFYADRVEGGVALAIIGGMAISEAAKYRPGGLHIYDDTYILGLSRLAEAIHHAGAKIGVQLQHAGRMVADPPQPRNRTLGPSSLVDTLTGKPVEALSTSEIAEIVQAFAAAAQRARRAGFDHLEVHGSHGYLPSAFLSPFTNRRDDAYGGSVTARARLICEIVEAVREAVGNSMTVGVRLNGADLLEGGVTLDDTILHARLLAERGVDVFHISGGTPDVFDREFPSGFEDPGCYRGFARAVRQATGLPVIAVGRINTPAVADEVLSSGDADLVAIGRGLIADPSLVRAAASYRDQTIRPCIACNVCVDKEPGPFPATPCSVNYFAGREAALPGLPGPVAAARHVLVVGAGPAGLEAARVAAERGHRVKVIEQRERVGGQMGIAGRLSHKVDFARWIDYAHRSAEIAGAEFRLGRVLDRDEAAAIKPDFAILATGALPGDLDIPTAEGARVVQAIEVLDGRESVGERVIVIGASRIGLVVAEHLAVPERQLTIIEPGTKIADEMGYTFKKGFVRRLSNRGVAIETRSRAIRIGRGFVQFIKDDYLVPGRSELVERPVDTVVLALERRVNISPAAILREAGIPFVAVGDCVEPRRIINAVHEAARAAILL
jgi:2,4-dienoyl-CoA reductase-like NADH-dependent reductase (Old Yellow Enzyme family)/thioredoxin reductase